MDEGTSSLRVIGLALKNEKWDKHINQSLLNKAREAGFLLKKVDHTIPLEEQGRLDAVLQKLRRPGRRVHERRSLRTGPRWQIPTTSRQAVLQSGKSSWSGLRMPTLTSRCLTGRPPHCPSGTGAPC
jgi:hypothetical protein